ncbi:MULTISPECIES: molybdenum cofactor guanylyltransferase MobA [unclassified Serratia (in: enterobacteria)]|uniref:molybdenum cofactor guanylyltransferase MobA n=1 Tax=unclassified Serratia (in: enterobacteria) TaxID=2647522 RepID=UPI00050189C7|nr:MULTISPECIES: molybdenum cofactor guanylyltransferase MobA [unclassified Serratia (in: enterobacteria)]KFK92987.1 molybdopterin-guanine dinucleotide biosynthesis protein MobA [Serratia sp. Ag1]KFK94144.1 molybdopterin-guanine dinucleotide biosynthesis protein MobA [Serratia sp. Ag2]
MHKEIIGVILAGGRSTRMAGEDKGLTQLGDKALYQHVLARLAPQVGNLIISANRNQQRYRESGLPVVSDLTADFPGPLAGILAGLHYAHTEWIVCAPCDVPDLPHNLVAQLWQHKGTALAAYASDGERPHPTLALLHTSLLDNLTDYLANGERKLMLFMEAIEAQQVIFNNQQQAFRNLNTPEDCQQWLQEKGAIDG